MFHATNKVIRAEKTTIYRNISLYAFSDTFFSLVPLTTDPLVTLSRRVSAKEFRVIEEFVYSFTPLLPFITIINFLFLLCYWCNLSLVGY